MILGNQRQGRERVLQLNYLIILPGENRMRGVLRMLSVKDA
jgi:hypothetical protein